MKIGIFSLGQPLARQVRDGVECHQPGSTVWVDLSDAEGRLAIDHDRLLWQGQELTALDKAWIHGFSYTNPVVPAPEEAVDWSVWQYRYLVDQQRFSAWYSLFSELVRRGVEVWHGPQVHMVNFMKHAQLAALAQAGLSVPDMVCLNTLEDAASVSQQWSQTVWRPGTGRAAWQLFMHKQMVALADAGKTPILLAEARQGRLLRIFMLEGQPVLCLAQFPPADTAPHETLECLQQWAPVPEPAALAQAVQVLGLHWCALTCIWDGQRLSFYDVDPDPVLGWLPPAFRDYLLASLSASLAGVPLPPPLVEPSVLERPNLFLRRMTRILYDFENSKYRV